MPGFKKLGMRMGQMLLAVWALMASPALQSNEAESVRLSKPELVLNAEGIWALDAEVQVTLNTALIDALKRGLPLVFVAEFEIAKKRWYWLDEKLLSQTRPVRLTYHSVAQQYRVSLADQQVLVFPTVEEALAAALNLRQWPLAAMAAGEMSLADRMHEIRKTPEAYVLRLRVRLDSSQLPRPLQFNVFTNRDWNLASDWVTPKIVTPVTNSGSGP